MLVELARREQAARRHQHLVKFIDDRGLADAGISRDQHEFRSAAIDDAIEAGKQSRDFALSPIQLLGHQQLAWYVVQAEREVVDAASCIPFGEASPQIALDTPCGLVTLLGRLGEQLHNDRRDGVWNIL